MTVRDLEAQATRKNREAAKARKTLRAAKKAERPDRVEHRRALPVAPGQRQPRQEDAAYLAWLHQGLPCIACVVEGINRVLHGRFGNPIEAAHQKFNLKRPGWTKFTGKRVHDRQCIPLCAWHHQHAPNACDKAQAKFWNRLGFTLEQVADLCADLYAAFKANADGAEVIRAFAAQRGEYSRHERLNTKPSIPEPKATR
jgi:hypothetical protein